MKKMIFRTLKDLVRFRTILMRSTFRDHAENHDIIRKMRNYQANTRKSVGTHQSVPNGNK